MRVDDCIVYQSQIENNVTIFFPKCLLVIVYSFTTGSGARKTIVVGIISGRIVELNSSKESLCDVAKNVAASELELLEQEESGGGTQGRFITIILGAFAILVNTMVKDGVDSMTIRRTLVEKLGLNEEDVDELLAIA